MIVVIYVLKHCLAIVAIHFIPVMGRLGGVIFLQPHREKDKSEMMKILVDKMHICYVDESESAPATGDL